MFCFIGIVTYFRLTFWVFGFLICFLSRLFFAARRFLLKRKVSNAKFFLLVQSQDFKLVCENDLFGCKAADCLKGACVVDCLLAVVWCETASIETRLTF